LDAQTRIISAGFPYDPTSCGHLSQAAAHFTSYRFLGRANCQAYIVNTHVRVLLGADAKEMVSFTRKRKQVPRRVPKNSAPAKFLNIHQAVGTANRYILEAPKVAANFVAPFFPIPAWI
jgi:hypothetical protein